MHQHIYARSNNIIRICYICLYLQTGGSKFDYRVPWLHLTMGKLLQHDFRPISSNNDFPKDKSDRPCTGTRPWVSKIFKSLSTCCRTAARPAISSEWPSLRRSKVDWHVAQSDGHAPLACSAAPRRRPLYLPQKKMQSPCDGSRLVFATHWDIAKNIWRSWQTCLDPWQKA